MFQGVASGLVQISTDVIQLAAAGFNKTVLERRKAYINSVDNSSGEAAREKLRKLEPFDNMLFGGKVTGLCKELRDSQIIGGQVACHPYFYVLMFLF